MIKHIDKIPTILLLSEYRRNQKLFAKSKDEKYRIIFLNYEIEIDKRLDKINDFTSDEDTLVISERIRVIGEFMLIVNRLRHDAKYYEVLIEALKSKMEVQHA